MPQESLYADSESDANVGGDLSSDASLFLIKDFTAKIGQFQSAKNIFETNANATYRLHKDHENLMQMIFQIIHMYSLGEINHSSRIHL